MENIIQVAEESVGERLDHFLVKQIPDLSRTKIQKMIKDGLVKINQKPAVVHQFLKVGDEIIVNDQAEIATPSRGKMSQDGMRQNDRILWDKIKVLDDNADYLVVEKPSGLLVHPTDKGENNTLIDWAISKYPAIRNVGEDPRRAAIVHRLDKEVSGLMVIPKTQEAFEHFKKLFKIRQIDKKYTALVYGEVKSDTGKIDFAIGRGRGREGLFVALPSGDLRGKPALTVFSVAKRFKNFALLEVEIMTGRTHQIRVHLKALGHPVVGDELYGARTAGKIKATRIFLHASSLAFVDPRGKKKEYQSKLPPELKEILERVK